MLSQRRACPRVESEQTWGWPTALSLGEAALLLEETERSKYSGFSLAEVGQSPIGWADTRQGRIFPTSCGGSDQHHFLSEIQGTLLLLESIACVEWQGGWDVWEFSLLAWFHLKWGFSWWTFTGWNQGCQGTKPQLSNHIVGVSDVPALDKGMSQELTTQSYPSFSYCRVYFIYMPTYLSTGRVCFE